MNAMSSNVARAYSAILITEYHWRCRGREAPGEFLFRNSLDYAEGIPDREVSARLFQRLISIRSKFFTV
jgi:hypothetical protein